jgi:hypothetical protein
MKAAHEGVPVAGLPLGVWRNPDAPNPFPPLLPPLDLTGAQAPTPLPGGRGGLAPVSASAPPNPAPSAPRAAAAPAPAVDSAPVPPAPVPNVGGQPGQRDKSLFNKIFGTL